jgi:hypothetical protein
MAGRRIYVVIYCEYYEGEGILYETPTCFAGVDGISIPYDHDILRLDPGERLEIVRLPQFIITPERTQVFGEYAVFFIKVRRGPQSPEHPMGVRKVWVIGWTGNRDDAVQMMEAEFRRPQRTDERLMYYAAWVRQTDENDRESYATNYEPISHRHVRYKIHEIEVQP